MNDTAPVMVAWRLPAWASTSQRQLRGALQHAQVGGALPGGRPRRATEPGRMPLLLWCDGDIATGRFFIEQESTHEGLTAEEAEVVRASRRRRMLESMVGYLLLPPVACARTFSAYFRKVVMTKALRRREGRPRSPPTMGRGAGGKPNVLTIAACFAPTPAMAMPPATPPLRGVAWAALPTEENSRKFVGSGAAPNCDGEFEAVDVTARLAPSRCVRALRGRFGKMTVVDVPRRRHRDLRQWGLGEPAGLRTSRSSARPLLIEVVEALGCRQVSRHHRGEVPAWASAPATVRPAARFCAAHRADAEGAQRERGQPPRLPVPRRRRSHQADVELFDLRACALRLAPEARRAALRHPDATLAAIAAAAPSEKGCWPSPASAKNSPPTAKPSWKRSWLRHLNQQRQSKGSSGRRWPARGLHTRTEQPSGLFRRKQPLA